ncbi:MAG: hypothetical protein LBU81_08130 [Methanosarcinales archaeon]|jgi:hypothetical protein|nr:hypothetical protein [Methanosarcinales archaeon]
MGFKFKRVGVLVLLIISAFSGCIGNGIDSDVTDIDDKNPVVIERGIITDDMILGGWIQTEYNYKLAFLENSTFGEIHDNGSYYSGTWRIENNTTLILTMETYDYSSNLSGESLGKEDVSFGSIKNGVLSLTSINEDPLSGFPAGDFVQETQVADTDVITTLNAAAVSGKWDSTGTNAELEFFSHSNNTFVFYANGDTLNGTWRIEYDNVLILTMGTYNRDVYIGKDDVSYGVLKGDVLSFVSFNEDFIRGFPSGNFTRVSS